jgi:hypothetical protein
MNTKYARLDEIAALLEKSNKAAKAASEELLGPRRYPTFRDFLAGREAEVGDRTAKLIAMLPSLALMQSAESVVPELTAIFKPLLRNMARRFARRFDGFKSGIRSAKVVFYDPGDLLGQVWIFFHQAIYGYEGGYKLVTYIRDVIKKEMTRWCLQNRSSGLNSNSSEYLDLLRASIDASQELWSLKGREPNLDEVYDYILPKFSDVLELRDKLMSVMQRVGGMEIQSLEHMDGVDDYTAYVADQGRLQDSELCRLQGQDWDTFEGMLTKAEITGVARAVMLARAEEVPLADLAVRFNLPLERIKTLVRKSRKKLRKLAA